MIFSCFAGLLILSAPSVADPDRETWISAVDKFANVAFPLKHEFVWLLNQIGKDLSIKIDKGCRTALLNFSTGLQENDFHSMALYDSFSKVRPGTVTFTGYQYGAYRQCLQHGRYVYMGLHFPTPSDYKVRKFNQILPNVTDWRITWSRGMNARRRDPHHFGICVPDECSEDDIKSITNSVLVRELINPLSVTVISSESRSDPFTVTPIQVIALLMIMGICGLGFWSAAFNFVFPNFGISQLLKPFDAYTNLMKLFSDVRDPESMATASNSYRCGYLMGSVFVHIFIAINVGTLSQRLEAGYAWFEDERDPVYYWLVHPLLQAVPSILTCHMTVTGTFTAVRWIPIMMKEEVSFTRFALERIFRTLPAVATYLIVIQTLPIIPRGGPLMKHVQESYAGVCWKNGWKELLFINNYADVRETCLPVAWFISAEFQLYLMSFVVLNLIAKYPRHAIKIVGSVIAFGIIMTGIKFRMDGISSVMHMKLIALPDDISSMSAKTYHTLYYISPYAIGIALGLILCHGRGIPRPVGYIKTILSGFLFIVAAYMPWFMHEEDGNQHLQFRFGSIPGAEVIFTAMTRSIQAAVFVPSMFAILNTRHPIMLWFSSTRFAAVFTRMALSFFMVHTMVIVLTIASYEDSSVSLGLFLKEFLFVIAVSFIPSCMLYACVEEPFAQIYSYYVKKRVSGAEKTNEQNLKQQADANGNVGPETKKRE
jgi:peptidoglycan/LPS O-acetylase OafA/YrhL